MGWFGRFIERARKHCLHTGYACDVCGGELFDYPLHRLCPACEEKLRIPACPCPLCGREGRAEGLCMDCKQAPPAFEKGVALFLYLGESALLINRVKGGNPRLAAYVGERMGKRLIECVEGIDGELLLLPVPMTKEKRREKGFNQAERLAEGVYDLLTEKGIAAEIDFQLLIKTRETRPQKRASRQERRENVRGAYHITDRAKCKGKKVVLIDDVMTTGSTGNEIAKKLYKAGARKVYLLVGAAVPEDE